MDKWMPGAERRPGPPGKVGYTAFGKRGPKRGDVKHSAEGSAAGLLTVLNGARRASWHFSVLKDGTVWQHYEVDAHCWHAGDVDDDGGVRANIELVGIEHEGVEGEQLTPEQVDATVAVTRWCSEYFSRTEAYARYPILPSQGWTLTEHNQVSDTPTACPSDRIPWMEVLSAFIQHIKGEDDMPAAFVKTKDSDIVWVITPNTKRKLTGERPELARLLDMREDVSEITQETLDKLVEVS